MGSYKDIEKVIADIGDLPAMPEIVAEVLELTEDPSADMTQLSALLEQDPALTAKLLRVTNSAYYGMRQSVGTLKLALVVLGMRQVRTVVMAVSLFDSLGSDEVKVVAGQQFASHSFLVAALAKKLGSHMMLGYKGEDFVSGLLHDIGKMVLSNKLGNKYFAISQSCAESGVPLYVGERAQLGFTHADVAAAVAKQWSLPETLTDAIWLHHPSDTATLAEAADPSLCAIVRIANLASLDDLSSQGSACFAACADNEAWEALEHVPVPLDPESRFETLRHFVEECKESAEPVF